MSERIHHILGPSSMSRIVECPGSKGAGGEEDTNDAAELGTLIHDCVDRDDALARAREHVLGEDREVLEKCVAWWQDFLIEISPDKPAVMMQEQYMQSKVIPDFGGTSDLLIVHPDYLHVADLKTGQGEVSVHDNAQIGSYLNLAREVYGPRERYYGTIVQPRLDYQETAEFSAAFLEELRGKIKHASESDDLIPGAHCRYCPLLLTCSKAQHEVEDVLLDGVKPEPDPGPLPEELRRWKRFVDYSKVFEELVSAAKVKLLDAISDGVHVPGYKAATHGARRTWANPDAAIEALRAMGLKEDQIIERKVRTPPQIEKLGVQVPLDLIFKPAGTLILAKANSRKRAATIANGTEFE